ncbi:MAG: CRISPR-associated endonuclease Cas2 [Xanthomonadales bacterium]|nr:CRISPR-associated endonuclease Cas2 [Xanthomonadales bacterium]
MLLSIDTRTHSAPPWVVFAYDIADPKRAQQARAALKPYAGPRQYSVFECRMHYGWARDLLAELAAIIDKDEDRLALWWPRQGVRIALQPDHCLIARTTDGIESGIDRSQCGQLLAGAGNYLVSYDIVDPARARQVHASVAAGGAMLQRSLYQWRCSAMLLQRLVDRCAGLIAPGDRFWVHPLRRVGDLWRVGELPCSLLPIGTHHWRRSGH